MAIRRQCALLPLVALILAASGPGEAEVRIGFANPLSGPYAVSGHRNLVAVETAVRDLNRNGGVLGQQVELVTADDRCGLEQALEAASSLVEADVDMVVGHMCSHSSLLAAGLYEAADVVMISPSSTHPRLTEEGRANVFRLIGRDDRQGMLAGDFLAAHWARERIAILHDGTTYGEGLAAETRQRLEERGVSEVIYDAYVPGQHDYQPLVDRLRQARIEILYVGGAGPDAALILRTARMQGYRLRLVGGDGLGMDEFWTVAGAAGEGTIFSRRRAGRSTPETAAVLKEFENRGLGTRPGGIGAYAAVQVWAKAVERAGTDQFRVLTNMLRRGRFETVLGPVSFDAKGDLKGAGWEWHVWTEGNYVPFLLPLRTQWTRSEG